MSLFAKKARQAATISDVYIGSDRLNTKWLQSACEFSPEEYAMMPKLFVSEVSYNALGIVFVDHLWNLAVGTVNGVIYKLAPYTVISNKSDAMRVVSDTVSFWTTRLGPPQSQSNMLMWQADDGNVILQIFELEEIALNLFLTSSAARQFKRL